MQAPEKYQRKYNENALGKKLKHFAKRLGSKAVYYVLLLRYAYADPQVPPKPKWIIAAALGYFIVPTDLLPDFIPGLGFTDDISALAYALNQIKPYLNDDHHQKAVITLRNWFGNIEEERLPQWWRSN